MLNEVPAAVWHEFGRPAVQCESQAPPGLLKGDGFARPAVDVEEQRVLIGELKGDQVDGFLKYAGQLPVRACDEARDLP